MTLRIYGDLALQNQAAVKLFDSANGYSVQLRAPSGLSSDASFQLPSSLGQNNQVLTTDSNGQFSFAFLADSNIASNAAISLSKLAAVTVNRALVSDSSGAVSASAATAEEIGHLSGVTSAVQTQFNSASARLDVLEGSASQTGSVAKALQDAKDYTDTAVADLVNSAPEALNTLNELAAALGNDANYAATVTAAIGAANEDIGALETAVEKLNASDTTVGSVAKAAKDAETSAKAYADTVASGLDQRLDKIEGPESEIGSIAKALKDAKDYADSAISGLIDGAPEALNTLNELAAALGDDANYAATVAQSLSDHNTRLLTIEGTGEGSVAKALVDAKAYVNAHKATLDWASGTSATLTHNWNTKDVIVQVYDSMTGETITTDVTRSTNSVTCTASGSASMWRVIAFNIGTVSEGGGNSGGGNSGGGSASVTSIYAMMSSYDTSNTQYTIYWNASAQTSEYVHLQEDEAGIWVNRAILGQVSMGYASSMYPLPNAAVHQFRLAVSSDSMGLNMTGVVSSPFNFAISGSGGGGPGPSLPSVSYMGASLSGSDIQLFWSAANASSYPRLSIVEVVGISPMISYTHVAQLVGANADMGGTTAVLASIIDPTKYYALAIHNMDWQATGNQIVYSSTFQLADGTSGVIPQNNLGEGVGYVSGTPVSGLTRLTIGFNTAVADTSSATTFFGYHYWSSTFSQAQIDEFAATGYIAGENAYVSNDPGNIWTEVPSSGNYGGAMLGAKEGEARVFFWSGRHILARVVTP